MPTEAVEMVVLACSCGKCHYVGGARVFAYFDETPEYTAIRHQRETRQRCVVGCLYRATVPVPAPAARENES